MLYYYNILWCSAFIIVNFTRQTLIFLYIYLVKLLGLHYRLHQNTFDGNLNTSLDFNALNNLQNDATIVIIKIYVLYWVSPVSFTAMTWLTVTSRVTLQNVTCC